MEWRVRQNNSEDTNFLEQREVYTGYLVARGYHSSIEDDAFNKFSDIAKGKTCMPLKIRMRRHLSNTHGDGSESSTSQHGEHYSQA